MKSYIVIVSRTETINYYVSAKSPEDAKERYMSASDVDAEFVHKCVEVDEDIELVKENY